MLSNTYIRRGMRIVSASNAIVRDVSGKEYIDFLSARSVANLGHCNPAVVAALCNQAKQLVHYSNDFEIDIQERFGHELEKFYPAPFDRFYLCCSGTEAVEAAIKLARARSGRKTVLSLENGFHGRTLGALSLTANKRYKEGFYPLVPECIVVSDAMDAMKNAVMMGDVAAIVVEPIRGEGGVLPFGDDYLHELRGLTKEAGTLLVFDEIQTGFGRCGGRFYCERIKLTPDILLASKSVAGGFPLGIVATTAKLDFELGEHGSTFSAHPMGCAAGIAALEEFTRLGLGERAIVMEGVLRQALKELETHPFVSQVRVVGAMVGIELHTDKINGSELVDRCLAAGVLVNFTANRVLRLMPPLTIEETLLAEGIERVLKVLWASIR